MGYTNKQKYALYARIIALYPILKIVTPPVIAIDQLVEYTLITSSYCPLLKFCPPPSAYSQATYAMAVVYSTTAHLTCTCKV